MSGVLLCIAIIVITLLGFILNAYILFVVFLSKELTTGNRLLLIHLAILNILLCSLFLLINIPQIFQYNILFDSNHDNHDNNDTIFNSNISFLCNIQAFLFTLINSVSIWNICGLNYDRYYAISSPLHYSVLVNQKKITLGLVIVWFICFIICIPPFFNINPYTYNSNLSFCVPNFKSGNLSTLWYTIIFSLLTFILPTIVILICNIRILMIARYHHHRIASAIFEVTLSAQVTITHQKNPFYNSLNLKFLHRKSAYNTVFEIIASFIILYLPYYIIIIIHHYNNIMSTHELNINSNTHALNYFTHAQKLNLFTETITELNTNINNKIKINNNFSILNIFYLISFLLIISSTLINSLLYGIKSKILRKSFQNYWRKQKSKCEIYNEIQARTPSTCGSRRPSLTPLGVITKPAPLLRRSSEISMDTSFINNTNKINNIKTLNNNNRQISISTSKLFLTTQEQNKSQQINPQQQQKKISNSYQNINKVIIINNNNNNKTTTFITSPKILITKTYSQDVQEEDIDNEHKQNEIIINSNNNSYKFNNNNGKSNSACTLYKNRKKKIKSFISLKSNSEEEEDDYQDEDEDDDEITYAKTLSE